MNSYHFDLGDSNKGPVGFSARVSANTVKDALELLRKALPEEVEVTPIRPRRAGLPEGRIEYIQIYLNADNILLSDVDDWEELKSEP